MSTNQPSFSLIDFSLLEKEYPGISRIQEKLASAHQSKLIKLTNLIKYNIPKHYYSEQIQSFAHFLQQTCLDFLLSQADFDLDPFLPAQIHRTHSPISDEEEAEIIHQLKQQVIYEPTKFSIADFQRYIQNFQITEAIKIVNPKIIDAVSQLQKAKCEKSVFQNFQHKQKIERKSTYTKQSSFKSRDTPRKSDRTQKQEITITMGDKIPLEVKQMRNYVKTASLQSFAISSIQSQLRKSETQKSRQLISLSLNKVAKQNIFDIFSEIKPLVTDIYDLSLFLVEQTINKCILQFRMIPIYLEFLCMFTNISQKQFNWCFNEIRNKNHKMNSFHCLLTQKLQQEFKQALKDSEKSKQLKSLGSAIGFLVGKKVLSRQIYLDVNNLLLEHIIKNCSQQFKQEHENYFESQLCLIQSLGQKYDQIWQQYTLQSVLSAQIKTRVSQLLVTQNSSMKQLLTALNEIGKFPTARVRCLIQNIFERKFKEIKNQLKIEQIQNNKHDQICDKVHQLLREQNGLKLALQFYEKNKRIEILYLILLAIFDGTQAQIKKNMKLFIDLNCVNKEQFYGCIQIKIVDLMYEQCDLPFMASGLSLLMMHYKGDNAKQWPIDIDENDLDYEDMVVFVEKILKKINYYSNCNDRQLCH